MIALFELTFMNESFGTLFCTSTHIVAKFDGLMTDRVHITLKFTNGVQVQEGQNTAVLYGATQQNGVFFVCCNMPFLCEWVHEVLKTAGYVDRLSSYIIGF